MKTALHIYRASPTAIGGAVVSTAKLAALSAEPRMHVFVLEGARFVVFDEETYHDLATKADPTRIRIA